ncbi:hypothetical protein M3M36_06115 [Fructobacillus americanaquae]|uniref:Mub B2-like domain-containing protein n=1 Tax=Fructobacillus americanaquae TaxID=2940302 RepID=A0ABY5BZE3_9LACO|nr:hypothetical protein M3M36_06115 [Fructobacillus americanaquae]
MKNYGTWLPNQSFAAVSSPMIQGYSTDQSEIASRTVTATAQNLAYTVTYTKDAPNSSHSGSNINGSTANNSNTEVLPENHQTAKKTVTNHSSSNTTADDADQLPILPLTGKQTQSFGGIFLMIVSGLATVVSFLVNKKEKN